ncbi:hypothetical protein Tco_0083224 [Tanacetum coccineum]
MIGVPRSKAEHRLNQEGMSSDKAKEKRIGGGLSEKVRMDLYDLSKTNLDVFVWKPAHMIGVPRSKAEHRLNQEGMSSDKAKEKRYALERNKTIQEEVTKLVEAHIKREVHYHNLLSNPMMGKSMMAAGGCVSTLPT